MSFRVALLSSTFLSSLWIGAALAADPLPSTLAVDGINGKVEALGGVYAKQSLYGASGSLSIPLQGQFGAQVDGALGDFAGSTLGVVAGHLFWRNPQQGLLGLYADQTEWDRFGGVHLSRFAGEGEGYWGRWTLQGVAGVEFGNNGSVIGSNNSTFAIANGSETITTTSGSLSDVTRFFDHVSLSYYVTDDWKATIGQRYMGGKNSLALGTEYALPITHGSMASLFAEGQIGEGSNNYGILGGVRFYFGQHDKSLIRRQREDDPSVDWTPDSLFSIANSLGPSSTSNTGTCSGEFHFNGTQCVANVSDRRLKCDVVLLARLNNGIGLYRYRYLWSDTVYVGVMAQDAADIRPDAVTLASDGYYRVDYSKLDLRLMTWDEWAARNEKTPLAQAA